MKIKCTACKKTTSVSGKPRGSWIVELLLWMLFLLPGFIYTIWRSSGAIYKCPVCTCVFVEKIEKEKTDNVPRFSIIGWMLAIFVTLIVLISIFS